MAIEWPVPDEAVGYDSNRVNRARKTRSESYPTAGTSILIDQDRRPVNIDGW